ncbi:LexA family transcriptional regulator [Desulfonatronum lacustre]|uniref:LexA family transcriptional regulator n=1 Tax=Desulfonatronum lacustre TaxID=66849 RepID=UPI00048BE7A7|nr:S24 family peptidase [Desulfonatronum lacustre]SMP38995.1 Phage repressor protein C, contains Cro/C1-type HTH and peptisase s24 domains [Desulfonatronum zhilinae]
MKFDDFFKRASQVAEIGSQKDLANLLGIEPPAITLAKTRGVPKGWALTLSSMFGVNPEWLKTGIGPVYQADKHKTRYIPKVSARACAGIGSLDVRDNIVDEIPFDRKWVARKGRPEHMVVMDVVGDSMSPELEPGDSILLDQSQTGVLNNNLYVVGLADVLQIKRVQARPGLITLYSTNQRYQPVTLQGDEVETLRVIGRVLWSSRSYA